MVSLLSLLVQVSSHRFSFFIECAAFSILLYRTYLSRFSIFLALPLYVVVYTLFVSDIGTSYLILSSLILQLYSLQLLAGTDWSTLY